MTPLSLPAAGLETLAADPCAGASDAAPRSQIGRAGTFLKTRSAASKRAAQIRRAQSDARDAALYGPQGTHRGSAIVATPSIATILRRIRRAAERGDAQ